MFLFPQAVKSLPTIISLIAALLPAVLLMRYIYRKDRIEKEPIGLLWKLILRGCIAGVIAILFEVIGEAILELRMSEDDPRYYFYMAFCVVAMVEEGVKLLLMKWKTWKDPNFNYRFDGIVYAAFVSLGFAAFENVGYIFTYGLSIAGTRALLAIPGHLGFSVFMGVFYGLARKAENLGKRGLRKIFMLLSFVFPVFLHGFYDTCCMYETTEAAILFFIFVAVMYVVVIKIVKSQSLRDEPIVYETEEETFDE